MVEARRFQQSAPVEKTAFPRGARARVPGEQNLMKSKISTSGIVVGLLLLMSVAASAAPVRGASKNGINSSQPSMNLFGPTRSAPIDNVGVAVQYICPNQDVADSFSGNFDFAEDPPDTLRLAGSCVSGVYKFLVQVQPTKLKKNLSVTFNNLVGFTPAIDDVDPNPPYGPTYGEQLCDSGGNTLELCTSLAEGDLPVIKTTINSKHTKVSFVVKNVGPTTAPAGVDYEGQGLTFFVIVKLTPKTPIAVPRIGVD